MAPRTHSFDDTAPLYEALEEHIASHTKAGALVCMPTGATPRPLYQRVRDNTSSRQLWASFRYLQLDEYINAPTPTETFCQTLERELLDPLGVPQKQRFTIPVLSGKDATEVDAVARHMDAVIESEGPIDLVVLGLGRNGHIAFNEPADEFATHYHSVALCPTTLHSNFPSLEGTERCEVRALTISVPQIRSAHRVCLVVPQLDKQQILDDSLSCATTPQRPASALRDHPHLDVFRVTR